MHHFHMFYCTNLPKNVNANKRGIYFAFYDNDVLEKEVRMKNFIGWRWTDVKIIV